MSSSLTWYESFFSGIAVDLWRRAITPAQTEREVAFLRTALHLDPGLRVLDVPCGLGRHALALAASGLSVSGIDLSAESIEAARASARERGLTIDFRQGDMREIPWRSEFDAAYCFGNSFGYLEPAETARFVAALSAALRTGARFAMHTGIAAESVLPNLRPRDETQFDDILFIEDNHYDAWESRVETTYTFVRNGMSETRPAFHWIYTVRDLRELFGRNGLDVTDTFSTATGEPFRAGAYELFLVARKR